MPTDTTRKRGKSVRKPMVELPILPLTSMTKLQLVAFGEQGESQRVEAGLELYRRAHKRAHADD